MQTVGERFVAAIAQRDRAGLRSLLGPHVDFIGLTPSWIAIAAEPDGVDDIVFANWFEEADRITAVTFVDTGCLAGVERVGYRFEVDTSDGARVVEQQAYYRVREDQIVHMRLVCSGFHVP